MSNNLNVVTGEFNSQNYDSGWLPEGFSSNPDGAVDFELVLLYVKMAESNAQNKFDLFWEENPDDIIKGVNKITPKGLDDICAETGLNPNDYENDGFILRNLTFDQVNEMKNLSFKWSALKNSAVQLKEYIDKLNTNINTKPEEPSAI